MAEVLIVDDIPKNIEVVSEILKHQEIDVSFALSGDQALNFFNYRRPDLVLLDIAMPGTDGFDVCRQLKAREETKDIPIIFLTAKKDSSDIVKGFELGGVDYITKPFNSAELVTRVRTQLEIKRSRDLIAKQNNELQSLVEQKDRFFSILAHDLKNPFSGFMGIVHHLKSEYDTFSDTEIKEYLSILYDSANHMYKLLENLLTWSQLQMDKMTVKPREFQLLPLIVETVNLFSENAREKGAVLNFSCNEEATIYADFEMIYTILRNIVSNAIKFIEEGGIVRIEAQQSEEYPAETILTISDTGIGMNTNTLDKLFLPDHRPHKAGTRGEPGTGLGLILCKEFTNLNNGTIHVSSMPGEGSVFTVRLPSCEPE